MATGKKKSNAKADSATKNAVAALKPINYSDPFGTMTKGTFTPIESQNQIDTRNTTQSKLNAMISNVPTQITAQDLYDNPFYSQLYGSYKRNLDTQREKDMREMENNLNARNQTGSSYDALQKHYYNQDYNLKDLNAQDMARQGAAQNWLQAYQNSLAGIDALRTDQARALDMTYMPAKIATGYQGAVSGLQQGQANAYMNQANAYYNQKTPMDNLLKFWDSTSKAVAAAM